MKVILIDSFASTASVGKITYSLYKKLINSGHDVLILHGYPDGINGDCICLTNKYERKVHYLLGQITGLNGYYSNYATYKALRIIKKFKPDVVQLFNLHGYYLNINKLLNYLKRNNINTVYSMLDEFPYLGRCCYSFDCDKFMNGCKQCAIDKTIYPKTFFFRQAEKHYLDKQKVYKGFYNICFVGPSWVLSRAKKSPMMENHLMYEVDEFVDTAELFVPRKKYTHIDKEIYSSNKIVVLTVAPYSNPRKGGADFIELAKRFEEDNQYLFIYVGMDVDNIRIPNNCKTYGFVSNQIELAEYYSSADVFICTSKADTMPNTCLESLSCGTPIIGYDITGVPSTAIEPYGYFVPVDNISGLEKYVKRITKKKNLDIINSCRKYALGRYSLDIYYKKMDNIYKKLIGEA